MINTLHWGYLNTHGIFLDVGFISIIGGKIGAIRVGGYQHFVTIGDM